MGDRARSSKVSPFPEKNIVHVLNVTFMNVGDFVLACKHCRYPELLV